MTRRAVRAAPALAALAPGGCAGIQSALDPAGPVAGRILTLTVVLTALGALGFAVFFAALFYGLFRRRRPDEMDPDPTPEADRRSTRWIVAAGVVFPVVVLVPVLLFTFRTLGANDPRALGADLEVEVVAKQWWWEIEYRDPVAQRRFETANELHVPVGRRVRLVLRSDDVIHSFWVPSLAGKTDLIPGRRNVAWIQADRAGVYRGQCAEYCGLQHAHMAFVVVAEPEADFERWAARQRAPAPEPATPLAAAGREVFMDRGCQLCHAVGGTPARGELGPDLTHLASRLTLAAGTLANTRGHLGGWILDPQAAKPGNRMPRVPLTSEEFHALLHYLGTLE
ncbi:MAG: cytochrome c oxidase subunit II [Gemmatimonadota bacterium]